MSGASVPQTSVNVPSTGLNTLDEPVLETLKRDLSMICLKFYQVGKYPFLWCVKGDSHILFCVFGGIALFFSLFQVCVPRENTKVLHDWDLWGPLLLCVTLAMLLRDSAEDNQKVLVFTGVFVIIWCGAGVVTLNSQLLGGKL